MPLIDFVKDKNKRHKTLVVLTTIYGYLWSLIKMIIGILTGAYFYLLSGLSTFFTGLNRHIYLRSTKKEKEKIGPLLMGIFFVLIGLFYLFYAMRLFFIEEEIKEYSVIVAIAIAAFSFLELGLSIYNFVINRKSKNMTVISFRTMNLALSIFAIVNTQNALLMAQGEPNQMGDAIFGVFAGSVAVILGIVLFVKGVKYRRTYIENEENK